MIRKYFFSVLMLAVVSVSGFTQNTDAMLTAFMKSFARGSLSTKIQVLQDSSKISGRDMCPLYLQASRFVVDNYRTLQDDSAARELSLLTVRLAGLKNCSKTADYLWKLFSETENRQLKIEIISALGGMDVSPDIVAELNRWLEKENDKMRKGEAVDESLVLEMLASLGNIGDKSSFRAVFSTGAIRYSDEITERAVEALKKLKVDYAQSLEDILKHGRIQEKVAVVDLVKSDSEMDEETKGRIFQTALEEALKSYKDLSESDAKELRELRLDTVKELSGLHWSAASALAVENFNRTLEDVNNGLLSSGSLIDAINFLGSVGTHEAAVRLSSYLEVLNSQKERGQPVNTQVVISVINNLNLLGDKSSFDNLLYAGYLDYPSSVKQAAREALNNLKTP